MRLTQRLLIARATRRSGAGLIAALGAAAAFAWIALQIGATTRPMAISAAAFSHRLQVETAAQGALDWAAHTLSLRIGSAELGADAFRPIKEPLAALGSGADWRVEAQARRCDGLIDLRRAPLAVIRRYAERRELASAPEIDRFIAALARRRSAERAPLDSQSRAVLRLWAERRIEHFTFHGAERVNLRSAPEAVMAAFELDAPTRARIVALRETFGVEDAALLAAVPEALRSTVFVRSDPGGVWRLTAVVTPPQDGAVELRRVVSLAEDGEVRRIREGKLYAAANGAEPSEFETKRLKPRVLAE